jgi:hypothetical protein
MDMTKTILRSISHTKLWQNLALSISISAFCYAPVMGMEDKVLIEKFPTNVLSIIFRHMHEQSIGRLKQTSKTMKKKMEDIGDWALKTYENPQNSEKIRNQGLCHAAYLGNNCTREKVAGAFYLELASTSDSEEGKRLSLCMELLNNKLFFLGEEKDQEKLLEYIIQPIYVNAMYSKYRSFDDQDLVNPLLRKGIFTLCTHILSLKEGVQLRLLRSVSGLRAYDDQYARELICTMYTHLSSFNEKVQMDLACILCGGIYSDNNSGPSISKSRKDFFNLYEHMDTLQKGTQEKLIEILCSLANSICIYPNLAPIAREKILTLCTHANTLQKEVKNTLKRCLLDLTTRDEKQEFNPGSATMARKGLEIIKNTLGK